MKKIGRMFIVLFVTLFAVLLSSCGQSDSIVSNSNGKYTIKWVDGNGRTIEIDRNVSSGTTPEYNGKTPNKKGNRQYTYTFIGWSPEITQVTKDQTYTALFSQSLVKYKITWKNEDGTILGTSDVEYGKKPVYDGEEPTKESDDLYSYKFSYWSPTIWTVSGDCTYTAKYTRAVRHYTLTFKNYDGTVIDTANVLAGHTLSSPFLNNVTKKAVKESDDEYYYTFKSWSPNIDLNTYIYSDQEFVAEYRKIELPYTFHFDLNGGECDSEIKDKKTNGLYKKDFHFDLHKGDKKFRGWMYNGKIIFNSNGIVVNTIKEFKTDMTFVAVYENEYMVTVLSRVYTGSNSNYQEYYDLPISIGYVTPSATYAGHSNVKLTAIEADGYKFKWWDTENGRFNNNDTYIFGLWESDVIIRAVFEKESYTLSVRTNNSLGKVQIKGGEVAPFINQSVLYDEQVSLYAVPVEGARFVGWYSKDSLVSTNNSYAFKMPLGGYSLEARFEEKE